SSWQPDRRRALSLLELRLGRSHGYPPRSRHGIAQGQGDERRESLSGGHAGDPKRSRDAVGETPRGPKLLSRDDGSAGGVRDRTCGAQRLGVGRIRLPDRTERERSEERGGYGRKRAEPVRGRPQLGRAW